MKNFLFFVVLIVLTSCSNDSPLEEKIEETTIAIEVSYIVDGEKFPDINAKVYIYYGHHRFFYKYTYVSDGQFAYEEETIEPDQIITIESAETHYIEPKYRDKPVYLLIEGNYYPNSFASDVYSSCEYDIIMKVFFDFSKMPV